MLSFFWWGKSQPADTLSIRTCCTWSFTHVSMICLWLWSWELRLRLCRSISISLWSLDEVTSNILWESHEPLSHVLPLSPSCSVMSVVAWRHLPASRSPQQSDWHLCANLTKERPATKERPWGSVSLALYSSYRRMMEWQHFSFSMQLYLLRTLLSPRWISECPKLPEISRGGKRGN